MAIACDGAGKITLEKIVDEVNLNEEKIVNIKVNDISDADAVSPVDGDCLIYDNASSMWKAVSLTDSQAKSDWNQSDSANASFIENKPSLDFEPTLGNPSKANMILVSSLAGVRSWKESKNVVSVALSTNALTTSVTIVNDSGSDAVIASATPSSSGVMSAADKTKLTSLSSHINGNSLVLELKSTTDAVRQTITPILGEAIWTTDTLLLYVGDGTTVGGISTTESVVSNFIPISEKGASLGVASLDSQGKIPHNQVPAIAITDTFVVSSEAEMTSLVAETGDVAIRTDITKNMILKGSDSSVAGDWVELAAPSAVGSIDDLTDVDISSIAKDQILAWDNTKFVPIDSPIGASGLESITEDLKTGWRLAGWSPLSYGGIGDKAVDLSIADMVDDSRGATGAYSFASGRNTIASGEMSIASGYRTRATKKLSFSFGKETIANSENGLAFGLYNTGRTDTLLEIGKGTSDVDRKNAFEVYADGRIVAPELSLSLITAAGDESLVTKEYADDIVAGSDAVMSTTNATTGAVRINEMVRMTAAQYGAITPDPDTFYVIIG